MSNAVNLQWAFGMNNDMQRGVINLSTKERKVVFYAAAHTGVLYDYENRKQTLLQGHTNEITSICASKDGRWLVTSDAGTEALLIVWDAQQGTPVRTVFNPFDGIGCAAVDVSFDAKYVAALSAEMPQRIAVWEWTVTSKDEDKVDAPISIRSIEAEDFQVCIRFNPNDPFELVSNGPKSVHFYIWNDSKGEIEQFPPILASKDFKHTPGDFTETIFIPTTSQAMTGTVDGEVVVWDERTLNNLSTAVERGHKCAIKFIRLHNASVNSLSTLYDKYIVSCGDDGFVRVFDFQLRVQYYFERIKRGPLVCLSFGQTLVEKEIPDFIVASKDGTIYSVIPNQDNQIDPQIILVHSTWPQDVICLDCHPTESLFVAAGSAGLLHVWDYEQRQLVISRQLDNNLGVSSLCYLSGAKYIAMGLQQGSIQFIHADSLEDATESFQISQCPIERIVVAPDTSYIACSDSEYAVALLQRLPINDESDEKLKANQGWTYIGKYRSHTLPITILQFNAMTLEDPQLRLISSSEDKYIIEYNLTASSFVDGIQIKTRKKIERTVFPSAGVWYPTAKKELFLLTATSDCKLKLHRHSNFLCHQTLLGPTFGGPITKMLIMPIYEQDEKNNSDDEGSPTNDSPRLSVNRTSVKHFYLVYCTEMKIMGLVKLPVDGNPHKTMGFIAHPGHVTDLKLTHDARYIITAGGDDATVNVWSVYSDAFEQQIVMAGDGYVPFINMLEGGLEGAFYRDMQDYFYLAQLKSQGIDTADPRKITKLLKVDQVPGFLRALGYFPSEFEIENILNEIKYSRFADTGEFTDAITLEDLIKVYVNHRPVLETDPGQVETSLLEALKNADSEDTTIYRSKLVQLLRHHGEAMSEQEFEQKISTILQDIQTRTDPSATMRKAMPRSIAMPERVTVEDLVEKLTTTHFN